MSSFNSMEAHLFNVDINQNTPHLHLIFFEICLVVLYTPLIISLVQEKESGHKLNRSTTKKRG